MIINNQTIRIDTSAEKAAKEQPGPVLPIGGESLFARHSIEPDAQQMHAEVVNRMRILSMPLNCIEAFEQGAVSVIEPSVFIPNQYICVPCSEDRWTIHTVVEKLQTGQHGKPKAVIYAVIKNYVPFGEVYTGLGVSTYMDEWEIERRDLEYAFDNTNPDLRVT